MPGKPWSNEFMAALEAAEAVTTKENLPDTAAAVGFSYFGVRLVPSLRTHLADGAAARDRRHHQELWAFQRERTVGADARHA
jgi:hypothetical protein